MQIQTYLPQTKVYNQHKIDPSQKSNNSYKISPAKTSTVIHDPDQAGTSTAIHNPDPSEKLNHLHQKFVEYGKNAKEWFRKCALLLPEIEKQQVWRKKGFHSIYEYAARLANMSQYQVNEALRTVRKTVNFPELRKIVEIKGVNAVRPVLTIVNKETEHFWAEKAKNMSQHTLETYVRDYKKEFIGLRAQPIPSEKLNKRQKLFSADAGLKLTDDSKTLTINLKPETVTKLEKYNKGDWNELMQKFIDLYEKNLEQELKQEKPEPVANASEYIPQNIRNYVLKRSHGKCEFPNCTRDYDDLHHTNRYSSNKIHDPDQIVALCEAHHDLAHRGLIDNEDQSADTWQIQKEPDYTNLNRYVDEKVQFYRRK